MRKFLSKFCITIGVLLILSAAGLGIYNVYENYRADKEASDVLDALEAELDTDLAIDSDDADSIANSLESGGSGVTYGSNADAAGEVPLYEQYPDMEMPTVTIDGNIYIGVLNIPRYDLTLPVMDEWSYPHLRKSPCRYTGSVYSNDITICGHNYTRHFGRLHNLDQDDVVFFTDADGNIFEYHVITVEILDPHAIEQMTEKTEEDNWDMTLFTCTLGGKTRYAIRLERVN